MKGGSGAPWWARYTGSGPRGVLPGNSGSTPAANRPSLSKSGGVGRGYSGAGSGPAPSPAPSPSGPKPPKVGYRHSYNKGGMVKKGKDC